MPAALEQTVEEAPAPAADEAAVEPAPLAAADEAPAEEAAEEAPVAESPVAESPVAAVGDVVAEAPTAPSGRAGDALILTLGASAATFTVARSGATLGRGEENTIRLDDLSVSRRHARIAYRQGGYWLSDLGSMGGTWVDGTRLNAPRRIAVGELIDIGHYRLTASFAEPAQAEPKKGAGRTRREMAEQGRRRR
jgi:hypothetical protein